MRQPVISYLTPLQRIAADRLADGYREASLYEVDMIRFAEAAERFRSDLKNADSLTACIDALDDLMGRLFDAAITGRVTETFRKSLLDDWIETISRHCRGAMALAENPMSVWLSQFLDMLFTWRTQWAATWARETMDWLPEKERESLRIADACTLITHARWMELLPIVAQWLAVEGLSMHDRSRLYTLQADILMHKLGDAVAARQQLGKALNMQPELPYALQIEGCILLETRQLDKARGHFEQLPKANANDVTPQYYLAQCDEYEERRIAAILKYEDVLAHRPGHTSTLHRLCGLLPERGQTAPGEEADRVRYYIAKLLAIEPEAQCDICLTAAGYYQSVNALEQAKEWLENAGKSDPGRPDVYDRLGQLYQRQAEQADLQEEQRATHIRQATEYFRMAIERAPGSIEARWNLMLLLQDERRYDEALLEVQAVRANCPGFERLTWMQECYLRQSLNQWDEAAGALLRAAEIHEERDPIYDFIAQNVRALRDMLKSSDQSLDPVLALLDELNAVLPADWLPDYVRLRWETTRMYPDHWDACLHLTEAYPELFEQDAGLAEARLSWMRESGASRDLWVPLAKQAVARFAGNATFTQAMREATYGNLAGQIARYDAIAVYCRESLVPRFWQEAEGRFVPEFAAWIESFRSDMHARYGIRVPGLQFKVFEDAAATFDFYSSFEGSHNIAGVPVPEDQLLVDCDAVRLRELGIEPLASTESYPFWKLHWVDGSQAEVLKLYEIPHYDPLQAIFIHLHYTIWRHLPRFVHLDDEGNAALLDAEPDPLVRRMLMLQQMMLEHKRPLVDRDYLLQQVRESLGQGASVEALYSQLTANRSYAPVFPVEGNAFRRIRIGNELEQAMKQYLKPTDEGNMGFCVPAVACQQALAAFRDYGLQPGDTCLASEAPMAMSFANMTGTEFFNIVFETATRATLASSEDRLIEWNPS